MKIYFVRHGEGEHNVKKLYSASDFSLTEKGKQQAKVAAERVSKLPVEIIIASSYKRTIQTAKIINKKLKKKIVLTNLVWEIVRPKEIAGKPQNDSKVMQIKKEIDENFHLSNWHYSNEENFYDLEKRASAFLKYLKKFKNEHILVVSHIHFIRMVVLVMLFKEDLNSNIYLRSMKLLEMKTSGLTICEYKNDDWYLVTWNDHAHLAEGNNVKFQS